MFLYTIALCLGVLGCLNHWGHPKQPNTMQLYIEGSMGRGSVVVVVWLEIALWYWAAWVHAWCCECIPCLYGLDWALLCWMHGFESVCVVLGRARGAVCNIILSLHLWIVSWFGFVVIMYGFVHVFPMWWLWFVPGTGWMDWLILHVVLWLANFEVWQSLVNCPFTSFAATQWATKG